MKTACDCTAQPVTETDQPRSKLCSTLQKGIGWYNIAKSRSGVSMTWSIVSKTLIAWGHMSHNKTTMSRVPSLERPINGVTKNSRFKNQKGK